MNPHTRLKMLLEGDMHLMNLNTRLNRTEAAEPMQGADGAVPVSESNQAKQGVSGERFAVYHDPENPEGFYKNRHFPLSYIRTYVVGESPEPEDNHLTQINQDVDPSNGSPKPDLEHSELPQAKPSGVPPSILVGRPVTAIPAPSSFTPAVTMARFPFKYVHGEDSKRVNARFYEGDKFWNRTWDLYYLQVPKEIYQTPFLLIPTMQAQALLDEINSALNIRLTLTGPGKEGLVVEFDDGTPVHPTLLGQSSTPAQKAQLEASVPSPFEDWAPNTISSHVTKDFEEKIKQSVATIKLRKKKDPNKEAQEARKKKWEECLSRLQACFGLRPPPQANVEQPSFVNGQIEPIDVLNSVKWSFHDAPIFISIDVEWNECYPSQLTEVGISTLDMMDLRNVPPADYGEMWISQIRSRHLRVSEYRNWVNWRYVQGCPTRFGFGTSEMIPNAEISTVVDAAFHPPYMVASNEERVAGYKKQKRTVILVGLNLHNDLDILRAKNCQVFVNLNGPSSVIREIVDVGELYRVEHRELQLRGLESLLGSLNILSRNLHNAGNDANYTLQALVRLMLQVAGEKPGAYERI